MPGATAGLAWVELSTGRFWAAAVPASRLADELARINPAECLLAEEAELAIPASSMMITRRTPSAFTARVASELEFFLFQQDYPAAAAQNFAALTPSSAYRIDYQLLQPGRDAVQLSGRRGQRRVRAQSGEHGVAAVRTTVECVLLPAQLPERYKQFGAARHFHAWIGHAYHGPGNTFNHHRLADRIR